MKKLRKIRKAAFRREFTDEQMLAYFTKDDRKKKQLLAGTAVLGILSFCLAFVDLFVGQVWIENPFDFFFAAIAFYIIALIIWVIIQLGVQAPTDKEYDAWVRERADEYLRRALRKINQDGLSEEKIDNIPFIHGFVLAGTQNAQNYRTKDIFWKNGKDNIKRYSINVFRYFLPVKHQLAVFIIDINAVNHQDRRERIHEYFFNDVVAVTTEEERDQIGENDYLTQSFTLRISDGKPISATIRSQPLDHEQKLEEYELPSSSDVDDTIAKLRLFLRTYKQK
jgi:hypothetical protein